MIVILTPLDQSTINSDPFFTAPVIVGIGFIVVVEVVVVVVVDDVVTVVVVGLVTGLGSKATTCLGLFCRTFLQENVDFATMNIKRTQKCFLHNILIKDLERLVYSGICFEVWFNLI